MNILQLSKPTRSPDYLKPSDRPNNHDNKLNYKLYSTVK